jgi:hypothetical protein
MIDCGHVCCEQRANEAHSHAIAPDACQVCETVRTTGEIPMTTIYHPITTNDAAPEDWPLQENGDNDVPHQTPP